MQDIDKAGAVIYAKDLRRLSRFYAEVLGLSTVEEAEDHIVLQSTAFELVVVAIPAHIAQQISVASPPVRREGTPIKLWFAVPGIDRVRECAARHGGELNAPERTWRFNGYLVCDGHDPEGNVFQVRELLQSP